MHFTSREQKTLLAESPGGKNVIIYDFECNNEASRLQPIREKPLRQSR